MSWVRTAVENVKLQGYERLHQTVYGGYGTKPDIFWALDPYDMPERLKENVEDTVKDDGSSEATCAIIRMETLPAFDDEELRESGNPLGCFLVYMGTDPSNVEYTRRINIYEERRPETPPHLKELTDINGVPISRLKRLSVNLGWSDPYFLYNKPSVARHSSVGPAPAREYGSVRRRMTLQAGWVDRSRRRSSAHENKPDLPSAQKRQSQPQPQFDRRTSSRRLKRSTMFPALSNVSENQAVQASSDTKKFPAPASPPMVHEIEVASASSPKPSLEARPSGDGKVRSRRAKRAKASPVIRESRSESSSATPQNRATPPSPSSPGSAKRERATEAALLALEGKTSTAGVDDDDDLPQYLIDAQRVMAPPAPPAAQQSSRPSSPGRVDAAVRKLKTLSLSAVGRGSPEIRAEPAGEESPPPRPSPARSLLHQRIDAASRKLKTLSMASVGMEIHQPREAEPAQKPGVPALDLDTEPEAPTPPPIPTPSKRRTLLFFGAPRNQTDSYGGEESSSSSPPRFSRLIKTPRKPFPAGQVDGPAISSADAMASVPPKPQGQAVSRVRETTEVKRASRLKRFSTHVSRLFN